MYSTTVLSKGSFTGIQCSLKENFTWRKSFF